MVRTFATLLGLITMAGWPTPVIGQPDAPIHDSARTMTFDPIALCDGREVQGDPALVADHAGFTYLFESPAARDAFVADPERYGVQFNGACARMGPLSGLGDARRWAVHEGRIYLFASESCRETFIKHPDRLLERDDREPLPAQCEDARGRELLARAIEWTGGADALAAVRTCIVRRAVPYEDAGQTLHHHETLAIEFGERGVGRAFRNDDWLRYGAWGEALHGAASWGLSRDGADGPIERTPLAPSQHRVLERQIGANLLVALRAAALDDALVATSARPLSATPRPSASSSIAKASPSPSPSTPTPDASRPWPTPPAAAEPRTPLPAPSPCCGSAQRGEE